jgi:hypothetical protein
VLFEALLEVKAWHDMHDSNVGGQMNSEDIMELAKRAGFDKKIAEKIARERAWQRLKRDLPA